MPTLQRERLASMLASRPLVTLSEVAAGHPARVALVGGAIRDALIGRAVDDLDLVVEEELDGFLDRLAARVGRRPVAIGDRFQHTHRLRLDGRQIDIARSMGPIERDLERRDFTINALAVPLPAGDPPCPVDPAGGLADLERGVLRETGPAVLAEDPLRLLRAVRYATVLEGFRLDAGTLDHVARLVPLLESVAVERIRYEWERILEAPGWVDGLALATRLGLVEFCFAARPDLDAVRAWGKVERATERSTRLAALLLDVGEQAGIEHAEARLLALRWPKRPGRRALRIARWVAAAPELDLESAASLALEDPESAEQAALLAAALDPATGRPGRLLELALRAREPRWLQGADLRRWGMGPGRDLGELLQEAWRGQVLGRWSDRGACRRWARARAAPAEGKAP